MKLEEIPPKKNDRHIGGRKLVCGKRIVPQQRVNYKDKHWTLLELTALSGDPIMCVIIFAGKRHNPLCETGIDIFAEQVGEVSDEDYFKRNSGQNKRYPGGCTCVFQGKEVLCMTRWSPKGSITTNILTDILRELDHLQVFDCSGGK